MKRRQVSPALLGAITVAFSAFKFKVDFIPGQHISKLKKTVKMLQIVVAIAIALLIVTDSAKASTDKHWKTSGFKSIADGDNKHVVTSTHELADLFEAELKYLEKLVEYQESLRQQLESVEELLNSDHYRELFEVLDYIDDGYVENPLNAFGLIRRTSDAAKQTADLLAKNSETWKILLDINATAQGFPENGKFST